MADEQQNQQTGEQQELERLRTENAALREHVQAGNTPAAMRAREEPKDAKPSDVDLLHDVVRLLRHASTRLAGNTHPAAGTVKRAIDAALRFVPTLGHDDDGDDAR